MAQAQAQETAASGAAGASGEGVGITSMDLKDPIECWEDDIDTSSVSSDSSVERVERNADKARRRLALEEWVDVEDDEAGGKCASEGKSKGKGKGNSENKSDSERDESEDERAVHVRVRSRISAGDKFRMREILKLLKSVSSSDPTVGDELEASLPSLGVTGLRNARRGFVTRQESDLGSLGSQGGSDDDMDSGSGIAPGPDEQCWNDSDSDSDSGSDSGSGSDLDSEFESGDEGDHDVRSVSSGEEAGEDDDTADTPSSSLAASALSTQFGAGCGHELELNEE
ncbi:hypothetical protein JCM24511_01944 [Saitozyma sp. JCM 24511]|nr:hypothetical protein JCM24511_01944 [Saitozyma sp. JCM 24511]